MLKQILFSLTFLLCLGTYAQCIPNTAFSGLLGVSEEAYELTDSTTALPHAVVGSSYETFFYMRIPTDTAITYDLGDGPQDFDPVYITTIGVNMVEGLPEDFQYECASQSPEGDVEENNCVFEGGGYGCLRLSSTNVTSPVGVYPLNVVLDISASYEIFGNPIPVDVTDGTLLNYLVLIIEEGNNSGIGEIIDARNFDLIGVSPNPAKDYLSIQYGSNQAEKVSLKIYDILGNLVLSKNNNSVFGYNEVSCNTSTLLPGIYTLMLSNNSEAIVERIIIK